MTNSFRPSDIGAGGADSAASFTSADAGSHGVSAAIENQLTSSGDIAAARQFFQPASAGAAAPAFTGAESAVATPMMTGGAESTAIAAKAVSAIAGVGAEAAAMGASAHAGVGALAATDGAISPIIQLIMKLPGLTGVAQSFFEWLGALFGGATINDLFNPTMWASIGEHARSAMLSATHQGVSGDHFQISFGMLPGNAQFFQNLGHNFGNLSHNVGLNGQSLDFSNISGSGISGHDHLNISGGLDLKKPQFEMGGSQSSNNMFRMDGKLSGPEISNNFQASHLAGTQRLFNDISTRPQSMFAQSASATPSANSVVSSTGTPAGSSSLNIGNSPFSQELAPLPANYNISDGVMSGPSVSSNVGYKLSEAAGATLDNAPSLTPSGGVSDTLGGNNLLASNEVPNFQPSMGGYFKPAVGMPRGVEQVMKTAPDSGLQGLKAEPMSLMKKVGGGSARPTMDHIGHQSKGAIPHTQHSTTNGAGTAQNNGMDQVSHRGHDAAAGDHAAKASKHASSSHEKAASHAKQAVKHDQIAKRAAERVSQPEQQVGNPEQTAMQQAGTDNVGNYKVQHGDCLWEIAKKNLGDGARWTEIYKMNSDLIGSNPDLIHTGLDLKMPGATDATQVSDATGGYTVKSGDNLWDIAEEKLGDGSRWGEIYKANEAVIGGNPSLIHPGQQLDLGGQTAISSTDPSGMAGQTTAMQGGAPAYDPSQQMPAQQMSPEQMQMQQQVAPGELSPDQMAPQMPQNQSYVPQQGIPQGAEVSAMPQEMQIGPGAAAAATLNQNQIPSNSGPVSASLAPDLSFLYETKQR